MTRVPQGRDSFLTANRGTRVHARWETLLRPFTNLRISCPRNPRSRIDLGKSLSLHRHRHRISSAQTQCRNPTMYISADHLVDQRHQNARTTRANRMTDCYCASIHVHFLQIEAELPHYSQGLHGEGFVELIEI